MRSERCRVATVVIADDGRKRIGDYVHQYNITVEDEEASEQPAEFDPHKNLGPACDERKKFYMHKYEKNARFGRYGLIDDICSVKQRESDEN